MSKYRQWQNIGPILVLLFVSLSGYPAFAHNGEKIFEKVVSEIQAVQEIPINETNLICENVTHAGVPVSDPIEKRKIRLKLGISTGQRIHLTTRWSNLFDEPPAGTQEKDQCDVVKKAIQLAAQTGGSSKLTIKVQSKQELDHGEGGAYSCQFHIFNQVSTTLGGYELVGTFGNIDLDLMRGEPRPEEIDIDKLSKMTEDEAKNYFEEFNGKSDLNCLGLAKKKIIGLSASAQ